MPLFVVRPSRGTWGFFGLVVLGVLGVRAMNRHEARVIRQDRPASEHAHQLAACLLGPNRAWVLSDPDNVDAQLRWTHGISTTLRAMSSIAQPDEWPRVCLDPMIHLQSALARASTSAPSTRALAGEVRALIEQASRGADERLALADNDRLATRVAALLMQVRALSTGSRATWGRELLRANPPVALQIPDLPLLRGLPGDAQRPVLADVHTVFARGGWNGYAQAIQIDGRRLRRVLLDPATPLLEAPHGRLMRGWRDDGPVMLTAAPRPRVLPLPDDFVIRDVERFRWDSSLRDDTLSLLTLDGGTATLRTIEADLGTTWSAPQVVGTGEEFAAAMLAAPRSINDEGRVIVLRPRLTDSVLEQHALTRTQAGLTLGPAMPLEAATRLPGAYAEVETCRAGSASYMVFATQNALIAARIEGDSVRIANARLPLPRGARLSLRCDEQQALALPSQTSPVAEAAHFRFNGFRSGTGVLVERPPGGASEVVSMLLVRDGVLAIVTTPGAMRAWRYRPRAAFELEGSRWEPGGMLMDLAPSPRARRRVVAAQAASEGDSVAVLVELAQSPRELVTPPSDNPMAPVEETARRSWSAAGRAVLVSHDGGRRFAAPY